MKSTSSWERFKQYQIQVRDLDISFDFSRMRFEEADLSGLEPVIAQAGKAMNELEGGSIANPDEKRMVGHYWLRNAALAPSPELQAEITGTVGAINEFVGQVKKGVLSGSGGRFRDVLVVGIGGSALGPQFLERALPGSGDSNLKLHFFDNTDPDGMEGVLGDLSGRLGQTLTAVISKSGGTKETRNGMLEAKRAYQNAGLNFAAHAIAITGTGSNLEKVAQSESWLGTFPMWDWVGGRTSELSAVGLVPAALQGVDIEELLEGAKIMDEATRVADFRGNPAAMMAATWYLAGKGKGEKNMVIVPYKDRLELFSKYLQQLVMESLGKKESLAGDVVHQGLSVFGNKGSTDQHAYIQQLRDGRNDFFVTFIQVLKYRTGTDLLVEDGVTTGDYLFGFLVGTQEALSGSDRESMLISIPEISPKTVGALIAVFERAVGLYASMIGINAYHQPGVEAGKIAAGEVIDLQLSILKLLSSKPGQPYSVEDLVATLGSGDSPEICFRICEHLAANRAEVVREAEAGKPFDATYTWSA